MLKSGVRKWHLQRNRRVIARIPRAMPMSRHICRIRSDDQAILASLNPRLVRAIRERKVDETRDEENKPYGHCQPDFTRVDREAVLTAGTARYANLHRSVGE